MQVYSLCYTIGREGGGMQLPSVGANQVIVFICEQTEENCSLNLTGLKPN